MEARRYMRKKALELLGAEDTGQSAKELADQIRMAMEIPYVFGMEDETVFITKAMIKDGQRDLPIHQVHGDRQLVKSEIEIRMTVGDGGALLDMNEEQRAYLHEKIRRLVTDEVGTERYRITEEVSARAEADTVLASRIGAMNCGLAHVLAGVGASLEVGKEYLYVKQPGGEVRIGDLSDKLASMGRLGGKPLTAEDFHLKPGNIAGEFAGGLCRLKDGLAKELLGDPLAKEFLAENVRSDLTPQAACALSLMAPITSNGKAPANILPRGVDDKE